MVIDKIEKTGKSRYAVWADGAIFMSVTSAQLVLLEITEGDVLEGDRLARFMKQSGRMAAKTAMDLLIRRDFSEAELKRRLMRKGFCEQLAEYGLCYVRSYHYTDDERYAASQVQHLQGTCSYRMMRMKLQEKGLSSEIIDKAAALSKWDDRDGIRREIRRKYAEKPALLEDNSQLQTKCIQALLRKGYHYGDIREVLRESLTML